MQAKRPHAAAIRSCPKRVAVNPDQLAASGGQAEPVLAVHAPAAAVLVHPDAPPITNCEVQPRIEFIPPLTGKVVRRDAYAHACDLSLCGRGEKEKSQ